MNDKDATPSEEPQSARGAPGSRDTGSDEPGGGETDRPSGSFDDEIVTSSGEPGWTRPDTRRPSPDAAEVPRTRDAPTQHSLSRNKKPRLESRCEEQTLAARAPPAEESKPTETDEGTGPAHQSGVRVRITLARQIE
ncbi:hypothetical protein GCM10027068_21670 [Prescottella soli]